LALPAKINRCFGPKLMPDSNTGGHCASAGDEKTSSMALKHNMFSLEASDIREQLAER
jgi:hypothetical protein